MNKIFKFYFLCLIKNIFSELLTDCKVGSLCDDQICSIHGNCALNIFNFYNNTSSNLTLNALSKKVYCICHKGYLTYYPNSFKVFSSNNDVHLFEEYNNSSIILCCYKQKKQMAAFILELIFGFGVGHFYLGNYFFAVGKLLINTVLIIIGGFTLFIFCSADDDNEKVNNKNFIYHPSINVIMGIIILLIALQFLDICFLGIGYHTDGNGQKLDLW
jgi:hypothetical protein